MIFNLNSGGGSVNSNMFYDPNTDGIYLVGKDGVPVLVSYGGLLTAYLYNEGVESVIYPLDFGKDYYYNATYNNNYSPTKLDNGIQFSTTNQVCSVVGTENKIDLSDFTSVKIIYTENGIEKNMELDITGVDEGYVSVARNSNVFGIFVSSAKANFGHGQANCIKDTYITSEQNAVKILKKWWLE